MKKLVLLTAICFMGFSAAIPFHKKKPASKPQSQQEQTQPEKNDDVDSQVVLANVANMLSCLGQITTAPYDPVVVGPSIAQIGVSFINIIAQIFKSMPIRGEITHEQIEHYFRNLPEETKMQLVMLVVAYADCYRNGFNPEIEGV